MANAELPEVYIKKTIDEFERGVRRDKINAALRRALVLIFSAYSFDSATCELVSDEFRGHGASE